MPAKAVRYSNWLQNNIKKMCHNYTCAQCREHMCTSSWHIVYCFPVVLILSSIVSYIFFQFHRGTASGIVNFLCNFLICFTWVWLCNTGWLPFPLDNAKGKQFSFHLLGIIVYLCKMLRNVLWETKFQKDDIHNNWGGAKVTMTSSLRDLIQKLCF